MEEEYNVHHRALKLRDIAFGARQSLGRNSELSLASFDCTLDSLLALHSECSNAGALGKDKNVQNFTKKYDKTITALKKLRMNADDFEVKCTIGRGHFGEVVVCQEKSTRDVFAMKIMHKSHILQQSDSAFFNAERDIMALSTSPWLTALHYAFQDDKNLYLVMDYHPGGDLLNVMERKEGSMHEDEVRFYLAEITAGLKDLHNLGFVHRDLKPDNVLITRSGHIKLVDFGSVAMLGDNGKVMDVQLPVGTPEYISPEVLMSLNTSADYGSCCDWWSLGVVAYELLYEATPFEGDATSKIYNNIMNYKNSLTFPEEPKTSMEKESHNLIKSLLTDMDNRLTYEGVCQHPFFAQTDWDHLLDAVPPHIPNVSQPDDASNFDTFEPLKDADLKYPDFPRKKSGFSGRSLPFIGFTYTKDFPGISDYRICSNGDAEHPNSDAPKKKPTIAQKEMEEARRKTIILEQECEVYRSQLEDYHRKLEMEKSDRRVSDSRALQLLQEVKERGKLAQQLREEQMRSTEAEYSAVVEQLERERKDASDRAKKLQQKLQEVQKDRDNTRSKLADYKKRLAEQKESSSKEMAELQAKFLNLSSESSSKLSEGQKHFKEMHKRYTEALDTIKVAESAKRKAEVGLQKLQTNLNEYSTTTADINQQLKELKSINDSLQSKVDCDSKASDDLRKQSVVLSKQVKDLETQLEEAYSEKTSLRSSQQSLEGQVKELLDLLEDKGNEIKKKQNLIEEQENLRAQELMKKDEELARLESNCSSMETKLKGMEDRRRSSANEKLKEATDSVSRLQKEKGEFKAKLTTSNKSLKAMQAENETLKAKLREAEEKHKKAILEVRSELRQVQTELGEAKTKSLQQGDQMREARKARREVDQRNESLTVQLKEVQRECEMVKKQLKDSRSEVEQLCTAENRLKQAQAEVEILKANNETMKKDAVTTQQFLKELTSSSEQAHSVAYSYKSKFDSQEMNMALTTRKVKSLEQEVAEKQASLEEAHKQIEQLNVVRGVVEKDLESAEIKLETVTKNLESEKKEKLDLEQKLSKLATDMEKVIVSHSEELEKLSGQLVAQKELATKYSNKVLEVEKEMRLKSLALRDVQKELTTEKAVSSKFYDDIQARSREHCKLKAAHMKLVKEMQERSNMIAEHEQNLKEQRLVNEERQLQETRLQATISQQSKLIDYLQGGSKSPDPKRSKGLGKIKKGLKMGRKRDPVKDIDEWNKLKGIARKESVVKSTSAASITSTSSAITSSHTHQSVLPSSSFLSTTSVDSYTVTLSDGSSGGQVVSLNDNNHTDIVIDGPLVDQPLTTDSEVIVSGNGEVEAGGAVNDKIVVVAQHNIPHRFNIVSKSGLRSHSTCYACNGPIKQLQKLNKCDYCPVICHTQCISSVPNNCGLPAEMSAYMQVEAAPPIPANKHVEPEAPPPPKKSRLNKDPKPSPPSSKPVGKEKKKKKFSKTPAEKKGALLHIIAKNLSGADSNKRTNSDQGIQHSGDAVMADATADEEPITMNDGIGKLSHGADQNGVVLKSESSANGAAINGSSNNGVTSSAAAAPTSNGGRWTSPPFTEPVKSPRTIPSIYSTGFDSSKVVRMEKMSYPRNGILAEGWLVLTNSILSFYDRDPRGVTRKPISRFVLNKPGMAYVVVTSVTRAQLPHASSNVLLNAFGLEIFSSVTCSELYWAAPTLQSKIDWVEELQKVLGLHNSPAHRTKGAAGKKRKGRETVVEETETKDILGESSKVKQEEFKVKDTSRQSMRELKEVKIVPIPMTPKMVTRTEENDNSISAPPSVERYYTRKTKSTPTQGNSSLNYSDSLNLSIHSSMLNTSSDSSYI